MLFGPAIDDQALLRRKCRGIDRGDIAVQSGFTDVEGRLQPLHEGRQLGELNAVRIAAMAPRAKQA